MMIGKLEPVELRQIWNHEERDFSAWLEDNIEELSDTLDISISVMQREQKVGSFNVDLVAEDVQGT